MSFTDILSKLLLGTACRREVWPTGHYIAIPGKIDCEAYSINHAEAPITTVRNRQWQDYAQLTRADLLATDWQFIESFNHE